MMGAFQVRVGYFIEAGKVFNFVHIIKTRAKTASVPGNQFNKIHSTIKKKLNLKMQLSW